MSAARQSPDHRETARSACSLALALIQGRSVTPMDFERRYRADPAPGGGTRSDGARRRAFVNACEYLRECGFALERDPRRRGAMRLDRARTLAPARALEALDGEQELLEDLGHLLVALADAFAGVSAVEAHGAAAKLLRDFALNGPRRELAPATSRDQRLLRDAMATGRVVRVSYRREDGRVVQRSLEPLRHVHVEGQDFLVALDRGDDRVKTYHYEGFVSVEVTDERFLGRSLDLGCLFSPPFGYVSDRGPDAEAAPGEVVFRMDADREPTVRAELRRLLCDGCGLWTDEAVEGERDGDGGGRRAPRPRRIWTVHGEDPGKAASFALRLGVEVLAPAAYRRAYLQAIEGARRAFGLDEPNTSMDADGDSNGGDAL